MSHCRWLTCYFTGKERDQKSGLHYFEARYYGSTFARFTRVDPLLAGRFQLEVPQKLNLYAYVSNNPLAYADPTGLDNVIKPSGGGAFKIPLVEKSGSASESILVTKNGEVVGRSKFLTGGASLAVNNGALVGSVGVALTDDTVFGLTNTGESVELQLRTFELSASGKISATGIEGSIGGSFATVSVKGRTCDDVCVTVAAELGFKAELGGAIGSKKLAVKLPFFSGSIEVSESDKDLEIRAYDPNFQPKPPVLRFGNEFGGGGVSGSSAGPSFVEPEPTPDEDE